MASIDQFKKDYAKAYEVRDHAGMRAANDGANAIRTANKQPTYSSAVGDAQRAGISNKPSHTNNTGPYNMPAGSAIKDYYSSYLSDQQSAMKKAQEEAQRAAQLRTQQAVETNNAYIPQVNQQSDKQLQDAYIAREQSRVNAPQSLAAMGYTGGAAESSLMGIDTNYQNQRGTIEKTRNDSLDKIRQNAQNIQSTGNADLASLGSQYYNNLVTAQAQAAQQAQSQSNWQSEFDMQKQNMEKEDFLNSIGAYYGNFQEKINALQNDGDASNDWQIAPLQQERQKKLQETSTTTQAEDPSYATALDAYKKGIRTPQVLRVLGL